MIRLAVCALVVLLSAGCYVQQDHPSDAQATAYTETAPPVGEPVDYFMYAHCGVESITLGGQQWAAIDPLYGEQGAGSTPEGWGDYERGTLTLLSESKAVFESGDVVIAFEPDPTFQSECR